MSLPLRKCGLKQELFNYDSNLFIVTSLAEVWIETPTYFARLASTSVTSLAEVWIETMSKATVDAYGESSLPLRKCGLKHTQHNLYESNILSLPLRKCGLKLFRS